MKTDTVSYKKRWDEQALIASYREILQSIFKQLLDDEVVQEGDVMEHVRSNKFQAYIFRYDIVLKDIDHPVTFLFHIKFKNDTKKIIVESNSRRCIFTVPPTFKEYNLYKSVFEQIKGWKRGVDSEKLFLEYFFCLLKAKFPARILSAYKSSEREDKIKGIDFIVRFITPPFYEPMEVRFNLKSSKHFLRQHKNDHPRVSTFVFTPFDLEDELALKKRFFRFMLTARNERVVHF